MIYTAYLYGVVICIHKLNFFIDIVSQIILVCRGGMDVFFLCICLGRMHVSVFFWFLFFLCNKLELRWLYLAHTL